VAHPLPNGGDPHDAGFAARTQHEQAPLVDALHDYGIRDTAAFHTPGHRLGLGAPPELCALLGPGAFMHDLTILPGTDSLNSPTGPIAEAERLAALAWGVDQTFFLVNGSTVGNHAGLLGLVGPGDKVIVPRSAHRSTLGALILAGAEPVYVLPEWDPDMGISHGVEPQAVGEALLRTADARAVVVVSPTYHGSVSDVAAVARLCDVRNIPFMVDEAWGAHLHFHPELPTSAVALGADVVIHSAHKTLPALTQASMLHVQGRCAGFRRDVLGLLHSTSPSFLLLASLDAARQQMALYGSRLLGRAIDHARNLRDGVNEIPGLRSFGTEIAGTPGVFALDETRVTVDVSGLGLTGVEMLQVLDRRFDVQPEMAGPSELVFLVGCATTARDIDRTLQALGIIASAQQGSGADVGSARVRIPEPALLAEAHLTPREAFFAPRETVEFASALGRTCAEIVAPYPPGIPVLVPGERVTQDALDSLTLHREAGCTFNGPSDPSIATLKVVA
jgi:arginine decarboxylase